jgi:pimeloyl-ACP methyl ester carboxylesterase
MSISGVVERLFGERTIAEATRSHENGRSRAMITNGYAAASAFYAVAVLGLGCATAASLQPPAVQSGYAPVNGLKMYYEVYGRANGKILPLVLLHGGGSTIETSFGKALPALAKSRQVIAFEQQGHGRTVDIVDRPFTFEQSADDTAGLLRYLNIGKADFFGYSNGGHIALQMAINHPDLVRKMVIESAMFQRDGSDPGFWKSFEHAKLDDMPPELREAYLGVAPHPKDLPTFFAKSVQRMLNFKDWTPEDIQSINAPTLVVIGDHDIVRPEHAVLMFRLLPNAQLAVLPGTDHMTIVIRSDWLVPMIETFLDSPMPPARSNGKGKR